MEGGLFEWWVGAYYFKRSIGPQEGTDIGDRPIRGGCLLENLQYVVGIVSPLCSVHLRLQPIHVDTYVLQ